MTDLIHATAVGIDGRAVLLTGPSGAGKSDLALRLIDRGAVLVSDDQVMLETEDHRLLASAPASIAGRMEVRGIGIVAMPHQSRVPVAIVIDLSEEPERMPHPRTQALCGIAVPLIALRPFEASTPVKVAHALTVFGLAQ